MRRFWTKERKNLHAILVDGTAYDWNNLIRVLFARVDYYFRTINIFLTMHELLPKFSCVYDEFIQNKKYYHHYSCYDYIFFFVCVFSFESDSFSFSLPRVFNFERLVFWQKTRIVCQTYLKCKLILSFFNPSYTFTSSPPFFFPSTTTSFISILYSCSVPHRSRSCFLALCFNNIVFIRLDCFLAGKSLYHFK